MDAIRRAEIWDEVWAEYDARQAAQFRLMPHGSGGLTETAARNTVARRVRPVVQVSVALGAGLLLLGLWLAAPWLLAMRISASMGQGDAPALLRQFDSPVAMASLRAGMEAEIAAEEGGSARRFLSGMADRMTASWEQPERVAAWMQARARGARGEGSLVALSSLRAARPLGLAAFRLEYGPAGEEAGVSFDLAWQGDGFRVTALRFLDAPVASGAGTVVAMR
ncbi:hypothetical protein D9599_00740 [Roseomonas sp. KE2513]|uniref:hypothetical protein n=1 Tax=Roseomonas sp. KE2513 TaxID=2479202 RepID=UPI0018DF83BF|nr:hypothetical protein [Roseomonas sp. KE2513]MBI0534102.1 hypothetical protein [Roseomonas sp. KE2513]